MASRDFAASSGKVIGYLTTAAGIGASASSWFIGMLGKWYGFQLAFIVPVVFTALLTIVMAWLYANKRATRAKSSFFTS